jgi:hypothetical protein
MIHDIDGNPRFDLDHELNRFIPKQETLAAGGGLSLAIIFSALIWAVIVFLLWKIIL